MNPLRPRLSRRQFLYGAMASGIWLSLPSGLRADTMGNRITENVPAILTGHTFDLIVSETEVNFSGVSRLATTINGSIPAPTLVWREGDTVTIRVTNKLGVTTSIHWHGIILPFQMDGVPGISFDGIAPGKTFTYQFKVQQSGTYWYHSHSGFQEMTGMYGAIIILPKSGDGINAERDHVVLLSDWTDDDPMAVFARLKHQSDYYNFNQPTVADFFHDARVLGMSAAISKRQMWNEMRMNPTDLADLSASALTFLMNGRTAAGNWFGVVKKGERVRLRFINGSSNTFFDVRVPGLKMVVVQADGQNVEPVTCEEFRFGPGETYDVIVRTDEDAHTIFAQTMDRTGFVRGTLGTTPEVQPPVPDMDSPQWLSMTDMMGTMGASAGTHGGHDEMHGKMAMDHSAHRMGASQHTGHDSLAAPSQLVRHARTEYGATVDMRVDTPRTNLDDPGIGLRNNGRRVLTLDDLRTIGGPMDERMPAREVELHLTGNMERYSWSFDGVEFGQSTPVHFRHGERVRVILQNDTMMTHPMHLHGLWSELENDKGDFLARRHTIPIQPAQRISFQVTADALGRWAWHCHLLFHMDAGMFREVVVS